ncbi:hypothetical protein [Bacillus changyiensis]|uniref:hypothetical protein n=1 Tax=Bacillus changyiensis TaxID=3004103 RepID=UPI0022DEB0DF|nr:hypothetical protein [Bacillus changyiensis]MDA1478355.1 hypothetical protein [Bacillus changyiensis]
MKHREFSLVDEEGYVIGAFYQKILDDEGHYIPEEQRESPPKNAFEPSREEFYQPRINWKTQQWEEGLSAEEIEKVKESNEKVPAPIDEADTLRRQVMSLQRVCNILMKNQAEKGM